MLYRSFFHNKQARYLGTFYLHSIVRLFAVSIFQIFSGIYVLQTLRGIGVANQQALGLTALFFSLIFLVHALSIAPSIWLINRKGLRFSVFWGNIFLIGFFSLLYMGQYDPIFFIMAAVCGGAQIGMYWTAYHILFATLSDDKRQGEEIGVSVSLSAIASIGGPAFGGLIINYAGFGATFFVMTILIIIASFPLKYLPKQKDTISVDILQTVYALAPRKELRSYAAFLGAGAIDIMTVSFWPIYIFPLVAGYIGIGFVGSLIGLVSTITTLIIGFLIDKFGAKKILDYISPVDSFLWVLKAFIGTPFQVFLASGSQSLTTTGQLISLDAEVYERARHNNLVAYIVQREFGLAVGKFIFLLVSGILLWFGLPLLTLFIITGLISLTTRLYPVEPSNK